MKFILFLQTIDENELEIVLEQQGHYMTTKKEVREIMKDIDKDNTGTIDLMEYMAVSISIRSSGRELGVVVKPRSNEH